MGNWDKNDFQGKRKSQVEYSYKITFYFVILTILLILSQTILYLCKIN